MGRRGMVVRACKMCGIDQETTPLSQIGHYYHPPGWRVVYVCSHKCEEEWHKSPYMVMCYHCGGVFEMPCTSIEVDCKYCGATVAKVASVRHTKYVLQNATDSPTVSARCATKKEEEKGGEEDVLETIP